MGMMEQPPENLIRNGIYILVWAALVVLTATTVTVSRINLGFLNVVTALLIATAKAGLVLAFFMHLKYEARIFKLMLLVALATLAIIISMTFSDYSFR